MDPIRRRIIEADLAGGVPQKQKDAIDVLSRDGTSEEMFLLEDALRDRNPGVRYFARKAIEAVKQRFPDMDTTSSRDGDKLTRGSDDINSIGMMLENPNHKVRLEGVMLVLKNGLDEFLPFMKKRLQVEKHDFVKSALTKAVGLFGDYQVAPVIAKFLKDPDSRVRANAIEALELIGDPRPVAYVRPLMNDPDNRVRANCFRMLINYGETQAIEALRKMAESKEQWMQESASVILRMIERESDPDDIRVKLESPYLEDRIRGLVSLKRRGLVDDYPGINAKVRALSTGQGKDAILARALMIEADEPISRETALRSAPVAAVPFSSVPAAPVKPAAPAALSQTHAAITPSPAVVLPISRVQAPQPTASALSVQKPVMAAEKGNFAIEVLRRYIAFKLRLPMSK